MTHPLTVCCPSTYFMHCIILGLENHENITKASCQCLMGKSLNQLPLNIRIKYEKIVNWELNLLPSIFIHRILFPGGSTWFNQTNGYSEAGRHIYDIAVEMNEKGNYFPLWGTCLGFELLTYLSANGVEHRARCSSQNQALHLEFKEDFQSSRMFQNAPENIVKILANESVTANFHQFCVTEKVCILCI
jgi:hypothetical protein